MLKLKWYPLNLCKLTWFAKDKAGRVYSQDGTKLSAAA